jgi:hypothetical protein
LEIQFLDQWLHHRQKPFEFVLDTERVRGYVIEAHLTPGDPPHQNSLVVVPELNYPGHPRDNPNRRSLLFSHIRISRRLDG